MSRTSLFYRPKPLFGLDIGYSSLKVMQIDHQAANYSVRGYGSADFDPTIIKSGVINNPDFLAQQLSGLLSQHVQGVIDSHRVVMAVPAVRTFIRSVIVPLAAAADLSEAVSLEVEQYIPMPLKDLYTDYSVIRQTDKELQLLVAAIPQKVADSYLAVANRLNLEVIALEPSLAAVSRMFASFDHADIPSVLIDFGAISSDVIVYDGGLITGGTVPVGGENLTALIAQYLNISPRDAHFMKTQYGIGRGLKQRDILAAIGSQLDQIVQEVRRVMRYYEEHYENKKIGQIITTGGGSNLHGLSEFLTEQLRSPARPFTPWAKLRFPDIDQPSGVSSSIYVTAAGMALLKPEEIFA